MWVFLGPRRLAGGRGTRFNRIWQGGQAFSDVVGAEIRCIQLLASERLFCKESLSRKIRGDFNRLRRDNDGC